MDEERFQGEMVEKKEEEEKEEEEETVLDLTSWHLQDLEEVELVEQLTEIDLSANRLTSLDSRISQLRRLKKLCLRQNLFTDHALQPLSLWPAISALQELVLRDNKLTRIPDVSTFKDLVIFDVSFNEISSLKGMSDVSPTLKELYLSKNNLNKIEELGHLHQLRILELGSNSLRIMEGLQNMTLLQELWLGRNRIRSVELCGLKSLIKISLQSNRLTSMFGFQDCISLEELYLSHNGISKMEGLSTLVNLRVLDVSSNKLTAIMGIENLVRLEDLWLNDNQIASLDGIDSALAGSKEKLTTIYLEHNPCAKEQSYRSILRVNFPSIQQIDSNVY
ncbi:hypothetical protein KI387_013115 [Taxus chinensis]|uniref:Protein phosphatase 1 regulatory subunit pprA n=1 Tax=Taxus chinensis TaxID=29808 RepID=A0AA38CK90_TAXCH|nr:hypothetical protein KI387_013115 [Taxus chinensis]